ncbi:transforming growth factor beta activator LRRC33-like [Oratosquilla oratoria]|uniref:transforming growth factor beta activator LRRC33-like n=1 Tax=Oratosquilla oratoria TaxID=337810 RepID=UPI003F772054
MMNRGGMISFALAVVLFTGPGQCDSCPCSVAPNIHYPGTKVVSCVGMGLSQIPTACFDETITEVILSFNYLTSILAQDLENATNLKRFYAEYNDIKFIEETAFAKHPGMERIYLDENKDIDLLEGVFRGLTHLKELKLSGSPIQRLPDIMDLNNLVTLDLAHCGITHLRRPTFGNITVDRLFFFMNGNLITDLALDVLIDLPDDSVFSFDTELILWAQNEGEKETAINKPWSINLDLKDIKVCGIDGQPEDSAICDVKGQ